MSDTTSNNPNSTLTEAEISKQAETIYRQIYELSETIKEISPQNPRRTAKTSKETFDNISEKIGNILTNLRKFSENFQEDPKDRRKINNYITKIKKTKNGIDTRKKNTNFYEQHGYDLLFTTVFNSNASDTGRAFSDAIKNITPMLQVNILPSELDRMQNDFKAKAAKKQKEEEERRQREEAERQQKEEEERRKQEEVERKKQEQERKQKEEEERRQKEEEERRQREEAERKQKEEAERIKQEEVERKEREKIERKQTHDFVKEEYWRQYDEQIAVGQPKPWQTPEDLYKSQTASYAQDFVQRKEEILTQEEKQIIEQTVDILKGGNARDSEIFNKLIGDTDTIKQLMKNAVNQIFNNVRLTDEEISKTEKTIKENSDKFIDTFKVNMFGNSLTEQDKEELKIELNNTCKKIEEQKKQEIAARQSNAEDIINYRYELDNESIKEAENKQPVNPQPTETGTTQNTEPKLTEEEKRALMGAVVNTERPSREEQQEKPQEKPASTNPQPIQVQVQPAQQEQIDITKMDLSKVLDMLLNDQTTAKIQEELQNVISKSNNKQQIYDGVANKLLTKINDRIASAQPGQPVDSNLIEMSKKINEKIQKQYDKFDEIRKNQAQQQAQQQQQPVQQSQNVDLKALQASSKDFQKDSKEFKSKIKKLKEGGDFEKNLMSLAEEGKYDEIQDAINKHIKKIKEDNKLNIEAYQAPAAIIALNEDEKKLEQKANKIIEKTTKKLKKLKETTIPNLKIENPEYPDNKKLQEDIGKEIEEKFIKPIEDVLSKLEKNELPDEKQQKELAKKIKEVRDYAEEKRKKDLELLNKISILENGNRWANDKYIENLKERYKITSNTHREALRILDIAETIQTATNKKEAHNLLDTNKSIEDIKNDKTAKKDALKVLEKIKSLNEVSEFANTLKDKQKKLIEKKLIEKQKEDQSPEDKFVPGLVKKLTQNQWDDDSEESLRLRGQFARLNDETQKTLLKAALQTIFAEKEGGKNHYREQLLLNVPTKLIKDNEGQNKKDIDKTIGLIIDKFIKKEFKGYKREVIDSYPTTNDQNVRRDGIIADMTIAACLVMKDQTRKGLIETNFEEKVENFEKMYGFTYLYSGGIAQCRKLWEEQLKEMKQSEKGAEEYEQMVVALSEHPDIFEPMCGDYQERWFHGLHSERVKLRQINDARKDFNKADKLQKVNEEKPKKTKAKEIADYMSRYPNGPKTMDLLKSVCEQQLANEKCLKQKNKFKGNILHAVSEYLPKDTFKNVEPLKATFDLISPTNQKFSIEPKLDDTVCFNFVYSHADKQAREALLNDQDFTKKFKGLSVEKQERLLNVIQMVEKRDKDAGKDVVENSLISKLEIKRENKPAVKTPLDLNEIANKIVEVGDKIDVEAVQKQGNANEISSNPFYLANEEGGFYKNEEDILGKKTFTLQDSILGLVCAKDKKAGALTNGTRARSIKDKYGNKIEDKDQRVKKDEVGIQREAEEAAKKAIQRAGGDFDSLKKHTMPLLKDTEVTFKYHGQDLTLKEAVEVSMLVLAKKRQRQLDQGIINGNTQKEKSTLDQICDILDLTTENGRFSKKEQEEIKKAISAQLIATQAFTETFKGKNQALANKLENGKEQAAQKQKEADNVLGGLQSINNGKESGATMSIVKSKLEEQIKQQAQNSSQEPLQTTTPQHSGSENDSPAPSNKSSTELGAEPQPNTQKQNNTQPPIVNSFAKLSGGVQTEPGNSRIVSPNITTSAGNTKEQSGRDCIF